MGSSSRSASSQTTNNTSTTFGIQGANNGLVLNGNGNTVTDGGAFKVVGDLVNLLPDFFAAGESMVSDGFNAVSDLSLSVERQGESFLNASGEMYSDSIGFGTDVMRLGFDSMTEQGELMAESSRNTAGVANDAMGYMSDMSEGVIRSNERQTDSFLNASGQMIEGVFDVNTEVNRLSYDALSDMSQLIGENNQDTLMYGANVTNSAFASMDDAARLNADISQASMDNNFDLAELVTNAVSRSGEDNAYLAGKALDSNAQLAGQSLDNSTYLAEMTTKQIADSSRDANKQLSDGFDNVMDFANDFSRSDGAAIAESNNKMMMLVGGGLLAFTGLVVVASMRKAS